MSKICLVTGSTQGIGEETAYYLSAQGWTVVVSGRNIETGEQVVQNIKAKGGDALFIKADVACQDDIKSLHEQIMAKYGRLDAAVNNAGVSIEYGRLADLSTERVSEMMQINIMGVFWCMQEQIKIMLPNKAGRIVNMSSASGLHGTPKNGAYSATKHAVIGLTKSAALDYAEDGITITAVAPAIIKSKILDQAFASGTYSEEFLLDIHPVKRLGESIDVARAVSFLLESPWITGSVIEIDGGIAAK